MTRSNWGVFAVTVGFLALAVPTAWGEDEAGEDLEACKKACYEKYDTCSEECRDAVDNTMCAEECLAKKDDCTEKCE